MKKTIKNSTLLFSAVIALLIFSAGPTAHGQDRMPLLQKIEVASGGPNEKPAPSPTPLVKRTGGAMPTNSAAVAPVRRTSISSLANVKIPGYSGVLIEGLNGGVIIDSNSDVPFNPASNVKIATAYAVLKTFGPNFRFPTNVWTDGQIDMATKTLYGNLYVSGRDPMFNYEHALLLANELNRLGVKTVTGDLIVTGDFVMNYSSSPSRSGSRLIKTLNIETRSAKAEKSWKNYLINSKKIGRITGVPEVQIQGASYVQMVPNTARLLFTHESAPMRAIVKATLIFSNNFLSERLGSMLGGHYAVARIVHLNANIRPEEFYLASSSGLGQNRVTPRAMMKLLRALKEDLTRYNMTFADIMPVAGVDRGTLEGRFDNDFARGSVVGKTGTLRRTDSGVSTLCGEIQTKTGKYLFVIFNQRGGVNGFRHFQNSFVSLVQGTLGGAAPLEYEHVSIDTRLATARVSHPNGRGRLED